MRDLFQVVFELKKKEIELARQHIQSKSISDHQPVTLSVKTAMDSSHSTYNKSDHSDTLTVTSKYTHKQVKFVNVAVILVNCPMVFSLHQLFRCLLNRLLTWST